MPVKGLQRSGYQNIIFPFYLQIQNLFRRAQYVICHGPDICKAGILKPVIKRIAGIGELIQINLKPPKIKILPGKNDKPPLVIHQKRK